MILINTRMLYLKLVCSAIKRCPLQRNHSINNIRFVWCLQSEERLRRYCHVTVNEETTKNKLQLDDVGQNGIKRCIIENKNENCDIVNIKTTQEIENSSCCSRTMTNSVYPKHEISEIVNEELDISKDEESIKENISVNSGQEIKKDNQSELSETQAIQSKLYSKKQVINSDKQSLKKLENEEINCDEPTLEDLDRSIPQVDCIFIANLVKIRRKKQKEFLIRKKEVECKLEILRDKVRAVEQPATETFMERIRSKFTNKSNAIIESKYNLRKQNKSEDEQKNLPSSELLAQLPVQEQEMFNTVRPEYNDGFLLLDCRTVNEITSWGMIEGAKVLPAHEIYAAFRTTPEEFYEEYGFHKPHPEDIIICYCQYGPRSLMAAQILSWLGYYQVLQFREGYYEWSKQFNLLLRQFMIHDKESGNELRRLATFQAALELQREVAPEFSNLPIQEAQRYKIETTRSPGKLIIGEGLRLKAYELIINLDKDQKQLTSSIHSTSNALEIYNKYN